MLDVFKHLIENASKFGDLNKMFTKYTMIRQTENETHT